MALLEMSAEYKPGFPRGSRHACALHALKVDAPTEEFHSSTYGTPEELHSSNSCTQEGKQCHDQRHDHHRRLARPSSTMAGVALLTILKSIQTRISIRFMPCLSSQRFKRQCPFSRAPLFRLWYSGRPPLFEQWYTSRKTNTCFMPRRRPWLLEHRLLLCRPSGASASPCPCRAPAHRLLPAEGSQTSTAAGLLLRGGRSSWQCI
mmetsp:Transcript_97133/g.283836  ORF Transcript_97133/g.283836 Transcript_97133/m.283836 type:complete len:205 (-) Transcript_97133:103-717(-)